ncbi:cation transporter [Candidatus Gottesmanbacteria bacterium]|nr:cation transporter [Candidatus Gottesmanbacteria bacterium]
MVKKSYKVLGMHCTSCPLLIESDLEDIGVKASCNYAKETLEVEYDEKKISEETVRKTVQSSGYDTDDRASPFT